MRCFSLHLTTWFYRNHSLSIPGVLSLSIIITKKSTNCSYAIRFKQSFDTNVFLFQPISKYIWFSGPNDCEFEAEGMCHWTLCDVNTYPRWFRHSGATGSRGTGPQGDHTSGSGERTVAFICLLLRHGNQSAMYSNWKFCSVRHTILLMISSE